MGWLDDALLGAAPVLLSAAVIGLWRWGRPLVSNTRAIHVQLLGEPSRGPGYPARPGLSERLAVIEARTVQLEGNGGSHLADDIRQTRSVLDAVKSDTDQLKEQAADNRDAIGRLDQRVTDHRRRNEEQVRLLHDEVDRRLRALSGDLLRSETYRAALVELGFDLDLPDRRDTA